MPLARRILLFWLFSIAGRALATPAPTDTDGDGTSDAVEINRGTDPDRNAYLSFPEPLVYDLVRGLDARRGELEINVLALYIDPVLEHQLEMIPEIEYAIADGFAVEFEVAMTVSAIAALKVASQLTFHVDPESRWAHGIQGLMTYKLEDGMVLGELTHVGNLRIARGTSVVSLIGLAIKHLNQGEGQNTWPGIVANATIFQALNQRWTVGFEGNLLSFPAQHTTWSLYPQAHVQLDHRFRLQVGLGVATLSGQIRPSAALRIIAEL